MYDPDDRRVMKMRLSFVGQLRALRMQDRKMTNLFGLEFEGLENAGREIICVYSSHGQKRN